MIQPKCESPFRLAQATAYVRRARTDQRRAVGDSEEQLEAGNAARKRGREEERKREEADCLGYRLNSEIQAFYRYLSPTRAEYEVRLFIIELISRTVRNTWPDAEVHPFGSWQTQLYLPSG